MRILLKGLPVIPTSSTLARHYASKSSGDSESVIPMEQKDLKQIYDDILKVRNSLRLDPSHVGDVQRLSAMVMLLEPKIKNTLALSLSFSHSKQEHLTAKYLNIRQAGFLTMKPDTNLKSLSAKAKKLGQKDLWSSKRLHQHLCMLQSLVPEKNEVIARAWINALFFRAAAMSDSPQELKMVMNLEQHVTTTVVKPNGFIKLGGLVDYTAMMTAPNHAEFFLTQPSIDTLKEYSLSTLFVSEVKARNKSLDDNLIQPLCEMYVLAKELRKSIIRGALTDGRRWNFLFLKMNADGDGAVYAKSPEISLLSDATTAVSKEMTDKISGIIAYWILHSNEEISDHDWFNLKWD